jgi:hypothetical protein
MDRTYCTLAELYEDLQLDGVKSESRLMRHVRAASQFIEQTIGQFLPNYETKKITGDGTGTLMVPPLLSVTSVTVDGTALAASDYLTWPNGRHWADGPYSALEIPTSGSTMGIWSEESEGNAVAGLWGMYLRTLDLDALATTADATSTGLSVPDGSKVSPGMVLLIESEQMAVQATSATATDTTADLAEALDDTENEIDVTNGALVHAGEVIKVGFEQMKVEDIQTNTLMVVRGWNASKRTTHLSGAGVSAYRTFTVQRGANGTTAAAHTAAAVYQYQAPDDINYLCRQIAALMYKKSETGFIGRSGNDDLGTGFWVNEFPRNQIEAVKGNYFWGGR